MIRVYGLKNCDRCRRAMKELRQTGVEPEFVDVRAEGISPEVLARFHNAFGAALVNTRSTTWRGLDAGQRARDPLELLLAHPALMKRPVVDRDGVLSLGWK